MLKIVDITKTFGGIIALNGVSCDIYKGEIVGLIGPNGSGKTTLFNCISGIYHPNEGIIKFKGEDITRLQPYQICKKGIGRTFQLVRPFHELTVLQNILVGLNFGRVKASASRKTVNSILELVGLTGKKKVKANSLLLAERKRLEIARALATSPYILLLDEVAAGLNPTETDGMIDLLKRINEQGITLFVVEHVMSMIMKISDRIIVLNEGRKIAEGEPKKIAENQQVIAVYLGEPFI